MNQNDVWVYMSQIKDWSNLEDIACFIEDELDDGIPIDFPTLFDYLYDLWNGGILDRRWTRYEFEFKITEAGLREVKEIENYGRNQ